MAMSRRGFMHGAAALGVAAWNDRSQRWSNAWAAEESAALALRPTKDEATGLELLLLPPGFRYRSFGWTGDMLEGDVPTPPLHDGMAVIHVDGPVLTLCRNHECDLPEAAFGPEAYSYDRKAPGGCTNLRFNTATGEFLNAWVSLSGTVRNCAGGPTEWNTWLTCEETLLGPGDKRQGAPVQFEKTHGWVFEVGVKPAESPRPIEAMGRFVHEAVAIDPATGMVFQTEDTPNAGFYRYRPVNRSQLAKGGSLQMMKTAQQADVRRGVKPGTAFDVTWVDIADPSKAHADATAQKSDGCAQQGFVQGGTHFAGLEGCWHHAGKIYFTAKSGGDAARGQIWMYEPAQERLTLLFASPGEATMDMPDNVVMRPQNELLLICEDGDHIKQQRLHCLTKAGKLITLAANNIDFRESPFRKWEKNFKPEEWAGATFSPDGRWLFVNIQTPGVTFAITGPWDDVA